MSEHNIDIKKILQSLPHRYPFLLVDRVIDVKQNESAIAIKNVTFNEPHFMGHFPDHPIMPGVLIIEAMAQTAALMVTTADDFDAASKLVYFMAAPPAIPRWPAKKFAMPSMLL